MLDGVAPGTYLLRVAGFNGEGRYLGRFEQEVEFPGEVTVSPIWDPRKTREIALVSVDESGEPFSAPSPECVTNSNGRFVLFQSGDNRPPAEVSRLFLRDRLLQRTTLVAPRGDKISMSDDGRWLVFARNAEYFLFDRLSGPVRSLGSDTSTISPDGNFILSRGAGPELVSRTAGLRRPIPQAGSKPQLSADRRLLASLAGGIQIRDIAAGTIRVFPVDAEFLDMDFSGDGRILNVPSQGLVLDRTH